MVGGKVALACWDVCSFRAKVIIVNENERDNKTTSTNKTFQKGNPPETLMTAHKDNKN